MPSVVRLKNFEIYKNKHNSCVNNHSPNIFPMSIFPVLQQNSLCFPCLEKSKNQIPCFPFFPHSFNRMAYTTRNLFIMIIHSKAVTKLSINMFTSTCIRSRNMIDNTTAENTVIPNSKLYFPCQFALFPGEIGLT